MNNSTSFVGHKFRQLDAHLWESLESSSFYFPDPEKLNDPADCQIDLVKAFRLARADHIGDHPVWAEELFLKFAREVEERAKTCGIYSLSCGSIDGDEERLFWAHYAANHTGICLTFDIPYEFVISRMVGLAPIDYTTNSLFDALRKVDLSKKPDFDEDLAPVITAYLTTKAPEWRYEREARLISFAPGLQVFDRTWLKQICFGLRTPNDDRERMRQLAANYPDCNLVEAIRSEADLFRITLREVAR
ncbi:DUF2971 domain-containing protein [Burkholderia pseudomallei]|uniref:DUF2971 domain-containing protein n=1 Tax=Burkholderia pseudomallei TaxID=28450 RepID=UPI00061C8796|nr:DUF2971 domain-containing protein [Burkholderia pseudomallei]CPF06282.1 Protein of uncharacterised function (DUF2971) [Burkholderia pseudomallei]VBE58964.1 Protein of uncharacterised function (DUF2971) [Burkholderia pseudomallei]VBK19801.1 Protein of uncharacterised function (DUF2971) [Burkholderia pseudomallei]VBO76820.1 Protein of uncharacterised function (DUF2971) [Burkholderia pseudomallei]VBR85528.1 Protein of uncharacterised function (DUF2971) [Burkholderia pseudomallei]